MNINKWNRTYGICKSRETVGIPFFRASQVRMDSNTDTTKERIRMNTFLHSRIANYLE